MAHVIETLKDEHRNIARLLNALEAEVERLAVAADPDYEILQGIANYFCDYPDRCHHPKENAVFSQLRARYPDDAAAVGDLAKEHRDCGARARRFRENMSALYRDAVMPRETIVGAARSFIGFERRHMEMEEERLFPAAEARLGDEDWQEIESRLRHERDPLFGEIVEQDFRVLRDRLLAWEAEHRPA